MTDSADTAQFEAPDSDSGQPVTSPVAAGWTPDSTGQDSAAGAAQRPEVLVGAAFAGGLLVATILNALPAENGKPDTLATTVTQVSEQMSVLVREEIELAKAEMLIKVRSIARGTAAAAAGAVFGVFAVVFGLNTLAWGLDAIIGDVAGDIWIGFAIVFGVLLLMTLAAFLFAWRKLSVGPPAPKMALDEAKKIRETVATQSEARG